MKNVRRSALLVASLIVGLGCGMQFPTVVTTPSAPLGTISPSSAGATVPPSTEPSDATLRTACATRVLDEFIRAFNSGDKIALERVVGSAALGTQQFRWISFHDALGRDADYTSDGARKMLLARWSLGQRLTLVSVIAIAGPSWHGGIDAAVRLESRGPGVTAAAPIHGKTALSCVGSRIYLLSIGSD